MEQLTQQHTHWYNAIEIIERYPFATMLMQSPQQPYPQAWHLPFLLDSSKQFFHGHASANNPLLKGLTAENSLAVKLIFQAEHGYVSPTLSDDIRVPTWDYCVVHVQGKLQLLSDTVERESSMVKQISANETDWHIDQLDARLKRQMLSAIKVLKIDIEAIYGHFKMSQNKSVAAKTAIKAQFERHNKAMAAQYLSF